MLNKCTYSIVDTVTGNKKEGILVPILKEFMICREWMARETSTRQTIK